MLNNQQVLSAGTRKAEAIVQAAAALEAVGVRHAVDLDPSQPEHRSAYVGITGLGTVTWEYFCMCSGAKVSKPTCGSAGSSTEPSDRETPRKRGR